MIILKNTPDRQSFYITRSVIDTETVSDFETKDITITANGEYQIIPSKGKKAIKAVNLDVEVQMNNQDKEVVYTENGSYTIEADGDYTGLGTVEVEVAIDTDEYFNQGVEAGSAEQKAKMESLSITSNGTYNRDDGYNQVIVQVTPNLQVKEVTYDSNGNYSVSPDEGYDGLNEVKVTVDYDTSNVPFVVPAGVRFAYTRASEFPETWDWSEIENEKIVSYMFYSSDSLIIAPKLALKQATSISNMFGRCASISYVDMSDWDTSKITDMTSLFDGCSNLATIDFGTFDTSNNKSFRKIFASCQSLRSIPEMDASSSNQSLTLVSYSPIWNCYALRTFGGLKNIKNSWYADTAYSLSYESLLNIINGLADGVMGQTLYLNQDLVNQLSDDDIAIATNKGWTISPSKSITEKVVVTDLSIIPTSATNISSRVYDFSTFAGEWGVMDNYGFYVSKLPNKQKVYVFEGDVSSSTSLRGMFNGCTYLHYVNIYNTHNITNMHTMFANTPELRDINLSDWDVSNVTSMSDMFLNAGVETVDFSGLDLSNVTNMSSMFQSCKNLTSVIMTEELSDDLNAYLMFAQVTTKGTFYYNPAYDYSKIIEQLPSTWTAMPIS